MSLPVLAEWPYVGDAQWDSGVPAWPPQPGTLGVTPLWVSPSVVAGLQQQLGTGGQTCCLGGSEVQLRLRSVVGRTFSMGDLLVLTG